MPRQLTLERARLIVAYLERVEAYYEQQKLEQEAMARADEWIGYMREQAGER